MPPAKSGIADYSATLLGELSKIAEVTPFSSAPAIFDPAQFDIALYQIGNNSYHDFCYETALAHPGVVVIHEANLHHLIAHITIKRGDWEGYLREVEYDAGPPAMERALRARRLEVGPDYEGVSMLRRLLSRSRAAIVHSECVRAELTSAGFSGPVARIPHGAWIPEVDRMGCRHRLGISESTPLIGIFGFLKPYKRIAESLRSFARLIRVQPDARMILVGEPHPQFPLRALIQSLDLGAHVRVLGFTPIEDFVGYIGACDIVLNLRYPTVGENSGTLMRSLGLGKSVVVSNVGSFCELPDDICLKAPVDSTEEDTLFEFLNLLTARPDVRRELGDRARAWVERECNWPLVATRYVSFLQAVVSGDQDAGNDEVNAGQTAPAKICSSTQVEPEYIQAWAGDKSALAYVNTHLARLEKTLAITPSGGPGDRILEMGAYLQITPALRNRLGYGEVRGAYYGPAGQVDHRSAISVDGDKFECEVDLFDAERDSFPYDCGYFATVLCCELIEHLVSDPMHMVSEVNRVLKPGGYFILTTPNIGSLRAISAILQGYHPGFFPAYIRPAAPGEETDARHNREYTPREILRLLLDGGFENTLLETGPFRDDPKPEHEWVLHLLEQYRLPKDLRGDGIYAVGRKTGPVRDRYPAWLYS